MYKPKPRRKHTIRALASPVAAADPSPSVAPAPAKIKCKCGATIPYLQDPEEMHAAVHEHLRNDCAIMNTLPSATGWLENRAKRKNWRTHLYNHMYEQIFKLSN